MKKHYLAISMIIFTCLVQAQLNTLTSSEFNNITINNISFSNINVTNGNLNKMKVLFGNNLSHKEENDILIYKEFWTNDFDITMNSDLDDNYYLSYLKIYNNSVKIVVKGIEIRLGYDKSVFGDNFKINTNNGDNSVVFVDDLTGAATLAFKIDKSTNKITDIELNVFD